MAREGAIMVRPVRVVMGKVAGMTMVHMVMVPGVPSMATVVAAMVPTMPAAVSSAGQDLRDAVAQHERDD
jgi:hypothetical protein